MPGVWVKTKPTSDGVKTNSETEKRETSKRWPPLKKKREMGPLNGGKVVCGIKSGREDQAPPGPPDRVSGDILIGQQYKRGKWRRAQEKGKTTV